MFRNVFEQRKIEKNKTHSKSEQNMALKTFIFEYQFS